MRILTIDGGGARSIVAATILREVEQALGAPVHANVERLAGTSSGSILACALSSGMSADDALQAMRRLAPAVFPGTLGRLWSRVRRTPSQGLSAPRYDGRTLARALHEVFDPGLRFGDLPVPVDVPAYDVLEGTMWLLSSDREPDADMPVWEVCQASSSAPTYFPAHITQIGGHRVVLIDGGMGANNPAAVSIVRGSVITRTPLRDIRCISVGTGTAGFSVDDATTRGAIEWARDVIPALMGASSSTHEHMAHWMLGTGNIRRLQVMLPPDRMTMDDGSRENLATLEYLTRHRLIHAQVRMAVDLIEAAP